MSYWGSFFDDPAVVHKRKGSMARLVIFIAIWASVASAAAAFTFAFKHPGETAALAILASIALMFGVKVAVSMWLRSPPPEAGNGPSNAGPPV